MKSLYHIIIALAVLTTTFVGCSDEDTLMTVDMESTQEQNATFSVDLNLSIPDPIQVTSRSGSLEDAIKSITLLCFNNSGKLISTSTYDNLSGLDGQLTAEITYTTRVIHLIANQAISGLSLGSSTETAVTNMVADNDKMIYWARVEIPSNVQGQANIESWFSDNFGGDNAIKMLRNRAKVTVENEDGGNYFTVTGIAVVNVSDKGSVAPYHAENKFPTNLSTTFSLEQWSNDKYIHVPNGANVIGKTASDDVEAGNLLYPYESDNASTDPVSIIFKGYNNNDESKTEKYWRVVIPNDEDGTARKVRRNHHYKVVVTGHLLGGSTTFGEALTASPANDAILNISDELTAVTDGKFSLTVDKSSYVFAVGQKEKMDFVFFVEYQKGKSYIDPSILKVNWLNDNGQPGAVVENVVLEETMQDGNLVKLTGTVTVSLEGWTAGKEEVILIKYGEKLQRKVKIAIISVQNFSIDENNYLYFYKDEDNQEKEVNGEMVKKNINNALAKLTFSIPASYPTTMYPFNVLISTEYFNVKRIDGKGLSLIFPDDADYGKDNGIGYKYVYQVTAPGEQNIDLISSLVITEEATVILESAHFNDKLVVVPLMKDSE